MFPAVCLDFRRPMWTEIILKMFFFEAHSLELIHARKDLLECHVRRCVWVYNSSEIVPPHFVSAHGCDIKTLSLLLD